MQFHDKLGQARNKDASKMVAALEVPYLEVWYEDMLTNEAPTLAKIEHFLNAGDHRLYQEAKTCI